MQVLKEALRQNIKDAAIKTFKECGYQKASMRTIAEEAGMSVGNLYRYYKNKEALLSELVQPMITFFEQGRKRGPDKMDFDMLDVNLLEHSVFIEQLMEARMDFKDELFILFLRAEGSPFEGAKETFKAFLEKSTNEFLEVHGFSGPEIGEVDIFVKGVAASVAEAFCTNLELSHTEGEFLMNMLRFTELVVKPAIRNLIAIRDHNTSFRRISDEEILRHFNNHRRHRHHCGAKADEHGAK